MYKEQQIKLIAVDMDGTLLDDKKDISDYTVRTLEKVITKGVEVVPITGRGKYSLLSVLKSIKGINYAVISNGASILNLKTGNVITQYPLSKEKTLEVYELASSLGGVASACISGYIYMQQSNVEQINRIMNNYFNIGKTARARRYVTNLKDKILSTKEPVEKITVYFNGIEEKKAALQRYRQIQGIHVSYAFDLNIEINNIKANKGNALRTISRLYNIPLQNIMCIGDGINDIPMFKIAGFNVIMENAFKEVKDFGDYTTLSNNEDGAALAIEKIIL